MSATSRQEQADSIRDASAFVKAALTQDHDAIKAILLAQENGPGPLMVGLLNIATSALASLAVAIDADPIAVADGMQHAANCLGQIILDADDETWDAITNRSVREFEMPLPRSSSAPAPDDPPRTFEMGGASAFDDIVARFNDGPEATDD